MAFLDVCVITPRKIFFEGKAKSVILPGEQGEFEILPFHKPILSRLFSGVMYVDDIAISILRGIARCYLNKVVVVVEDRD